MNRTVDEGVEKFRVASCHVWNTYLMPGPDVYSPLAEEAFETIERELLRVMVFSDDPDIAEQYREEALGELRVLIKPSFKSVAVQTSNRDENGNSVNRVRFIF